MMVIAVGLSSYNIALFHLVNHAFYKGLLFLGAGAVIHAVADNQDFRKYGGLRPFLPLTYSVMLIASLSLVAFPFMTGFYSKDFILESAYGQFYFSGTVVYFIATIGAMFTTLYSVKVLYLTFLTNPNGPVVNYKHAHEGDIFMSLPLIILAIFSIFFGYITKDIFIGLGSGFFSDNSIFIHPTHEIMLDTEFAVPTLFKLLPLFFTISLSILAITISEFIPKMVINFKLTRLGYNIFGFFNQRFLIEMFYNNYITNYVLRLGGQTTKVLDKGSVELIGPYGLEKGLITLSRNIASLDTGVITSYALYILIGLIFYILIPYLAIFDNSLLLLTILALFNCIFNKSSSFLDLRLNSSSKPVQSDIGLIIYFLLTNRVFSKIFLFFSVGWLVRLGLTYVFIVDFSQPLDLVANVYYLFMVSLATFLKTYGLLNNLPSLFEIYNSIKHGINFNLKQSLFYGFDKMEIGGSLHESNEPKIKHWNAMEVGGEGSDKGKGVETNIGGKTSIGSRSGTSSPSLSDSEYWKGQLLMYKDALNSLGKPHDSLTKDEIYAKSQITSAGEYNKKAIEDSMYEIERNINFPINDSEAVRMEKVRLDLARDAEMRTRPFMWVQEKQALLTSAKTKLENLAEYGRKNNIRLGVYSKTNEVEKLTLAEIKCVVDKINSDPDVSLDIKKKVAKGNIEGTIGINHPIIKYLESITKK